VNLAKEHHGYSVTEDGDVFNRFGRRVSKSMMSGYWFVTLFIERKAKRISVHRLVCGLFNGPRPSDDRICAHLDGNPLNNHYKNLAWVTQRENMAHKRAHGTMPVGENHPQSKLKNVQRECIAKLVIPHHPLFSGSSVGKWFGVTGARAAQLARAYVQANVV
jgi:hypothetical protein